MKFVLLLRGINVGRKNKVGMEGLKRCLSARGFTNVVSYINSGNLIFDSARDRGEIKSEIETMLAESYTFGWNDTGRKAERKYGNGQAESRRVRGGILDTGLDGTGQMHGGSFSGA